MGWEMGTTGDNCVLLMPMRHQLAMGWKMGCFISRAVGFLMSPIEHFWGCQGWHSLALPC